MEVARALHNPVFVSDTRAPMSVGHAKKCETRIRRFSEAVVQTRERGQQHLLNQSKGWA